MMGVSIVAVSRNLGHSNVSTTLNIYSHAADDTLDDAMSRVDALLGTGS